MSRHEGVSCDSCLKGNFRGKRYKCLICYDYDLCATCYDNGATTTRHTTEHPMQCILTRAEFDLYYGGETISIEQPQSFSCPFCSKMGYTEQTLQEHVAADHTDSSFEVVCPVCAALPGGDPNQVTDDFAAHLSLEHRSPRDLISFVDEPSGSRHVRRIPHPGRGVSGTRARRANMHFSTSGGLASLSPSSRDSMDPIAELLSQLSGVRRSTAAAQSNTSSQLQQLQMQLQLERQQAQAARQQLERLPRRQAQNAAPGGPGASAAVANSQPTAVLEPSTIPQLNLATTSSSANSQFLLSRCTESCLSDEGLEALEVERCDRSLFVQEFLISTLADKLSLTCDERWDPLAAMVPACRQEDPPSTVSRPDEPTQPAGTQSSSNSAPASVSSTPSSATGAASSQPRAAAAGKKPSASSSASKRTTPSREVPSGGINSSNVPGSVGRSAAASSSSTSSATAAAPTLNRFGSGTGTVREVLPSPASTANATRAPLRAASPSARRKIQRHVDSRNHPNEPPPH